MAPYTSRVERGRCASFASRKQNSWRALCEHLRAGAAGRAIPGASRYWTADAPGSATRQENGARARRLRHDPSPWIAKPRAGWAGTARVRSRGRNRRLLCGCASKTISLKSSPRGGCCEMILSRETSGFFVRLTSSSAAGGGLSFAVYEEPLGVRDLSAAAISSRASFLFGRFEATLQATNIPGLVTGFFLHRDSPRQEIDVEILGNQPDKLLVNVFYNPGSDGAKFDYGYRGTPAIIKLGFDASKALHQFTIEWDPCGD